MRSFPSIAVFAVLSLTVAACGDDAPTIELTADSTSLQADEEIQVHVDVSGSEETILFETDLGGVGIIPASESEWTTSLGRADVPFSCEGEVGTATVSATWIEESLSDSVQIQCEPNDE